MHHCALFFPLKRQKSGFVPVVQSIAWLAQDTAVREPEVPSVLEMNTQRL